MLRNPRHESFAQGLVSGMTADAAYAAAGYKPDRGNAARLTANDSVRRRVAELQAKQEAQFEMSRTEWLLRLKSNADSARDVKDRGAERMALRELGLALSGWYAAEKREVAVAASVSAPTIESLLSNPATVEAFVRQFATTQVGREAMRQALSKGVA